MSGHTPGPWSHRNGRIFQTDYENLTIANVGRAFDGDYSPANGDLLAAAPDLLKALKGARHVVANAIQNAAPEFFSTEAEISQHSVIKDIDNAIAKAEGRS